MTTFIVEQDELDRFPIDDLIGFSKRNLLNIIVRGYAVIRYGKIEYLNRVH